MVEEPFKDSLLTGEKIIWTGQPGQGLILTPRDGFLIPFSLVWCGFAIFWTISATGMGAPGFFTLWGTMFVLIGLYFVVGRFILDTWIRRGIYYAVTNRRILINRTQPFFRSFSATSIKQLSDVALTERNSSRGTIRFGQTAPIWGYRSMSGWTPALDGTPQFLAIENARDVFSLIQKTRHYNELNT